MVGIESAGAGQCPEGGVTQGVGLQAQRGLGTTKRRAIRADAHERHHTRSILRHHTTQALPAFHILRGCQFGRRRRGALHHVGDAVAQWEQLVFIPRGEQPWRESRAMQRRPEAIARPREVVTDGRRVQPRVDTAEQHTQIRGEQIRHGLRDGSSQLGLGRLSRWRGHHTELTTGSAAADATL